MPKREFVLKSVKKGEPLTLTCEWETCRDSFTFMPPFMDHVKAHIENYVTHTREKKRLEINNGDHGNTENPADLDVGPCACFWQGCNHEALPDLDTVVRHVYFHAYHTKIKSIGMNVVMTNKLGQCFLDTAQRNIIPDLHDRLVCAWQHCSIIQDNAELFYLHVANHCDVYPSGNNVEGGCTCQWEGCTTVVKSKHKLKDHMKSHTQEKVVGCPTCGAIFSNMTRMYDHIKRQLDVNAEEGHSYECSHCNKKYASERLLKDHMRRHVNYYQCPFCDMTCPNPSNLRLHFRYRHSNTRPFICNKCTHTCKTQGDLNRHLETHKSWIYCDVESCHFRCHSLADLNQHSKLEHEMLPDDLKVRFLCHLCGNTYTKGYNLTEHLRKKHKFRWPPGHVRFRYNYHEDGFYRLQTVRYESIELTQQVFSSDDAINIQNVQNIQTNDRQNAHSMSPGSTSPAVQYMTDQPTGMTNSTGQSQVDVGDTLSVPSGDNVPPPIYDDFIVAKGDEGADVANANLSYNLDLLGNVAINDSMKEDVEKAEEAIKSRHKTRSRAKRKNAGSTDAEHGKKTSNKRRRPNSKSKDRSVDNAKADTRIDNTIMDTSDFVTPNHNTHTEISGMETLTHNSISQSQIAMMAEHSPASLMDSQSQALIIDSRSPATIMNNQSQTGMLTDQSQAGMMNNQSQTIIVDNQSQTVIMDSQSQAGMTTHTLTTAAANTFSDTDWVPMVQTMILPSGENIYITSDMPLQFAEPIHVMEDRNVISQDTRITANANSLPSQSQATLAVSQENPSPAPSPGISTFAENRVIDNTQTQAPNPAASTFVADQSHVVETPSRVVTIEHTLAQFEGIVPLGKGISPSKLGPRRFRPTLEEKIQQLVANKTSSDLHEADHSKTMDVLVQDTTHMVQGMGDTDNMALHDPATSTHSNISHIHQDSSHDLNIHHGHNQAFDTGVHQSSIQSPNIHDEESLDAEIHRELKDAVRELQY